MMWEVIGGADKGGILVREGQALSSKACDERLSTGARVKELQLVGERLRYELLDGLGPASGWVSVKISGKELLKPAQATEELRISLAQQRAVEDLEDVASDAAAVSGEGQARLAGHLGGVFFRPLVPGGQHWRYLRLCFAFLALGTLVAALVLESRGLANGDLRCSARSW
eukprot:s1291_g4.t3